MKKPAQPKEYIWEISRIKSTPAAILGRINAPDAETAIEEWIEKFEIKNSWQQDRLVARRVK